MKFLHGTNRRPDVDERFFFSGPPDAFEKGKRIMKARKPSDPGSRKLVGFFQVPPNGASPEAKRAWTDSILDAMERVENEEARARCQKASKKRIKENEL